MGKVVSKVAVPIAWDTKSGALANHLAEVGAQQLISVLQDLPGKLQTALPQPEDGITKGIENHTKHPKLICFSNILLFL